MSQEKVIEYSKGGTAFSLYPEKARQVLGDLYESYTANTMLYAHVARSDAPQTKHLPPSIERGGREHQTWLFFATLTDRRDVSELVYKAHNRLFGAEYFLYTNEVLELEVEDIKKVLQKHNVSMPGTSANNWLICAQTLFGAFGGDPLQMYQFPSIDAAYKAKKKHPLPGYGTKLLSLLALFYHEVGVLPELPRDTFPIDLHAQRMALATKIIRGKDDGDGFIRNDIIETELRKLFSRLAREEKWDVLELAHAIWFLGNRLCTGCHKSAIPRHYCPTYQSCEGPLVTKPYFKKGRWELNTKPLRKGGSTLFIMPEGTPLFGGP